MNYIIVKDIENPLRFELLLNSLQTLGVIPCDIEINNIEYLEITFSDYNKIKQFLE